MELLEVIGDFVVSFFEAFFLFTDPDIKDKKKNIKNVSNEKESE